MAEFTGAHALHDADDHLGLIAGGHAPGHYHTHGFAERIRAAFGNCTHNVPFREDADDAAICTEYNYRSNTLFGEKLCCSSDTGARFDRDDVAIFGRENSADGHFRLPMTQR